MQFIKIKIQTKKKTNKTTWSRQDLIPQPSTWQAACLPIQLRGTSGNVRNRHCQNKRSKNGAGSLALRRCQVYAKKYR